MSISPSVGRRVLLVIAAVCVLGIIAWLIAPMFRGMDSARAATYHQVDLVGQWLGAWKMRHGRFHTSDEGLGILSKDDPEGRTLDTNDSWGHPLRYALVRDGAHSCALVYSMGKNGVDDKGKADDISLDQRLCD